MVLRLGLHWTLFPGKVWMDACFSMTEDDAYIFLIRIYPVWQVSEPQPRQPAGTTDGVQSTPEPPVYVDRSFVVLIKSILTETNDTPESSTLINKLS